MLSNTASLSRDGLTHALESVKSLGNAQFSLLMTGGVKPSGFGLTQGLAFSQTQAARAKQNSLAFWGESGWAPSGPSHRLIWRGECNCVRFFRPHNMQIAGAEGVNKSRHFDCRGRIRNMVIGSHRLALKVSCQCCRYVWACIERAQCSQCLISLSVPD